MRVIESLQNCDLRMLMWCHRSRSYPSFIQLVNIVSRSGDGYLQVLLPLALWALVPESGTAFIQLVLLAFALERTLYWVLKNTLKRQRPPQVVPNFTSIIEASDYFSFPSGHTMAAFLLAGLTTLCYDTGAAVLYAWAGAVGISRVILGVHFPSDILAGAGLGTLIAVGAANFIGTVNPVGLV